MKETYTRGEVLFAIKAEKKIYYERIQRLILDYSNPARAAKMDAESALNALDFFAMNFEEDYGD